VASSSVGVIERRRRLLGVGLALVVESPPRGRLLELASDLLGVGCGSQLVLQDLLGGCGRLEGVLGQAARRSRASTPAWLRGATGHGQRRVVDQLLGRAATEEPADADPDAEAGTGPHRELHAAAGGAAAVRAGCRGAGAARAPSAPRRAPARSPPWRPAARRSAAAAPAGRCERLDRGQQTLAQARGGLVDGGLDRVVELVAELVDLPHVFAGVQVLARPFLRLGGQLLRAAPELLGDGGQVGVSTAGSRVVMAGGSSGVDPSGATVTGSLDDGRHGDGGTGPGAGEAMTPR
jgi:hypothetical protein